MSIKKWPGAVISDVPVEPTGAYQNSRASGVWTLEQAAYWTAQGRWPTAGNTAGWAAVLVDSDSGSGWSPVNVLVKSDGNYVIALNYAHPSAPGGYGTQSSVSIDSNGTSILNATQYGNGFIDGNELRDALLDSSDNIIGTGRYFSDPTRTGSFSYAVSLAKTNASSSNLGSYYLYNTSPSSSIGTSISQTSTGSFVIGGTIRTNNTWPTVVSYSSTFSSNWGISFQDSTGQLYAGVGASDVTLCNYYRSSAPRLITVSSSGTILTQRYVSGSSTSYTAPGFDQSKTNAYFQGSFSGSSARILSVKSDLSAVNFSTLFTGFLNNSVSGYRPVVDSNGNVYIFGSVTIGSSSGVMVIKVNSSGVTQWMRVLTANTDIYSYASGSPLAIDGDNFIITAYTSFSNYGGKYLAFVLKMPTDGAGAGSTFSMGGRNFTYDVLTGITAASSTLTLLTDSNTNVSLGASVNNSVVTPSAKNTYSIAKTGV